ncbi:hypothetical protein QFC19_008209 [Naganishia cerealis]|uniref:Uncharacterized protein n=1 Tax=Naganishia cerealis TaxID=610337 RepID=A0ACC2V3T1_9TREE|nr:hypothetical protein QFC19_008209 [Naganishia cerealis]
MPPPQHSQIQAINLRSLQRSDPAITAILAQAAYVVAYRAAEPTGEPRWDKMGVEGSLFVYQRCAFPSLPSTPPTNPPTLASSTAPPHKGVLILNRNGIHNYQKPLIPQHTTVHVEGSWVYIHGIDMDSLTPQPPAAGTTDSPSRRSNRRARAKPQPQPQPQATTEPTQTAQDPPSVTPSSYDDAKRTRVALYCHHSKESGGEEEARKLGQVLRR